MLKHYLMKSKNDFWAFFLQQNGGWGQNCLTNLMEASLYHITSLTQI